MVRAAFSLRYLPLTLALAGALGLPALAGLFSDRQWLFLVPAILCAGLAALGLHDLFQRRHAILRNYPIAAHLRFALESIRPEMRQYFFEADTDGTPFARDVRAVVYQRAKRDLDKRPFGTQLDVYGDGFTWLNHSVTPGNPGPDAMRVTIGPGCAQPYDASLLNISAMSYGALSANAIRALNRGARMGGFAHDTGEGGISPYHREHGGDLIWEIGSGYFGCRDRDGRFDPARFAAAAADPQVRMIEVKLSQGAKPGHGGVLPGPKVTEEIAAIRGVEPWVDCVSPPRHSAFDSPVGLLEFVARLRDISGGKPAGFKLCIGHPWEFMAICKAMVETGLRPDFIVVDGGEGGTGAAPPEFMDHVGMPLRDGLSFVHGALVATGLREGIRIGASGRIVTAFDMARTLALGADWCNAARGFMFAVGCIQAQSCHTGRCPTGVATQDPLRQRAIVIPDKAERVANFHGTTIAALRELTAAAGLDRPGELRPQHFRHRTGAGSQPGTGAAWPVPMAGALLADPSATPWAEAWAMARADGFAPAGAP